MNSLAIIPARGGSKRLYKKNIIDFDGKPIIYYTINAALKSNCFDRIVISTDDDEIFKISSKYHNDVVMRPKKLATDKSTVVDVCKDFLNSEIKKNVNYDFLTVLYPTAPMRNSKDIKSVFNKLLVDRYTSSLAVTNFSLPIHQALVIKNRKVKKVFPKIYDLREKKVPKYYVDNGSTYSIRVKNFLKYSDFITKNLGIHIMPPERSVDIDTSFQLDLAKFFFKKKHRKYYEIQI